MVKIMVPNPIRIHDLGGGSPICGNTQMDLEKKGGLVQKNVFFGSFRIQVCSGSFCM